MLFISRLSRPRGRTVGLFAVVVAALLGLADNTAYAKTNIIMHIVESAGWVFGPMLMLISIGLIALVVLLALDLRLSIAIPPGFVDEFTDTVNKRKFKEAFELARNDPSFLGRVLTAGMSRLQYGLEDAREAAANMLESIKSDKEQKNNYAAVIGTLGPLLGLVGTVYGMILAFIVLGEGGSPDPKALAQGISACTRRDFAGYRRVGAGDFLQRFLPESDHPSVDGHRPHRR